MNEHNQVFMREALADFACEYPKKFKKGDEEHGGVFATKPKMIKEAKSEVLDFWSYIRNIQLQNAFVLDLLKDPTPTNINIAKLTLEKLLEGC